MLGPYGIGGVLMPERHHIMLNSGSLHLFRLFGIQVSIHWSWFLVAAYSISVRSREYRSIAWNVAEYLALFAIVLLHEFGHSLACRQVGGRADRIVLWPLGGVAFVDPPPRPGATLWAIAAGPLVNVVLLPLAFISVLISHQIEPLATNPDLQRFLWSLVYINIVLLAFNLLPIYPLDGGQILRSLLWFAVGSTRSLQIAAVVGFAGALSLLALSIYLYSRGSSNAVMMSIMSVFILSSCWKTWTQARLLSRLEKLPGRQDFACPACHASPPFGPIWICQNCRQTFDMFATGGICPHCQKIAATTTCVHCGAAEPMEKWLRQPPPIPS